MSKFEWFEWKNRLTMPFEQTDHYYRTCLYPVLGPRAKHLGSIELWYGVQCMLKGFRDNLTHLKRSIEQREESEVFASRKEQMVERFMAW